MLFEKDKLDQEKRVESYTLAYSTASKKVIHKEEEVRLERELGRLDFDITSVEERILAQKQSKETITEEIIKLEEGITELKKDVISEDRSKSIADELSSLKSQEMMCSEILGGCVAALTASHPADAVVKYYSDKKTRELERKSISEKRASLERVVCDSETAMLKINLLSDSLKTLRDKLNTTFEVIDKLKQDDLKKLQDNRKKTEDLLEKHLKGSPGFSTPFKDASSSKESERQYSPP